MTALGIGALVAAGCGSSNDKTSSSTSPTAPVSTGRTLKISADTGGALRFAQTKLSAKAGKVTIEMANPASAGVAHGVAIEGKGVDVDGAIVQPGDTSRATADLKPGTYEYYCPVPSHKKAGMEGKLVVR